MHKERPHLRRRHVIVETALREERPPQTPGAGVRRMRNANCRAQGMVLDPARAERDEARSGAPVRHDGVSHSPRAVPQNEYSNPITGDTPLFSPELVVRGKSTCADTSRLPHGFSFTPAVPSGVLTLPDTRATVSTEVCSRGAVGPCWNEKAAFELLSRMASRRFHPRMSPTTVTFGVAAYSTPPT